MSIDKLKTKFTTGAWLIDVKHYFKKINEIIDWINDIGSNQGVSYTSYVALLTQSGTDAPVATILENTLGGTPVWTYDSSGYYIATLTGTFKNKKTVIFTGSGLDAYIELQWTFIDTDTHGENEFALFVTNDFGITGVDNALYQTMIEIRVYP